MRQRFLELRFKTWLHQHKNRTDQRAAPHLAFTSCTKTSVLAISSLKVEAGSVYYVTGLMKYCLYEIKSQATEDGDTQDYETIERSISMITLNVGIWF